MLVSYARWHQVPVNHRGDWLFVELTDSDGNTGWGEASHSGDDEQTGQVLTQLCDALTDVEMPEGELPKKIVIELSDAPTNKSRRTALSGIEQAVVDLQGRRQKMSVAQTLGASAESGAVPIYINLNRMCADRSPVTVANAGKLALDGGVTKIKFAPFDEVTVQAQQEGASAERLAALGRQRLAALRDAVGPEMSLMVDCHWRFDPSSLAVLADIAREFSITWIEDPFPAISKELSARLRDQTGALITGGEQLLTYEQFERYLESSGVDVLIGDVKHVGGINSLHRICRLAADQDIAFAPHNPSGPVSTAASAHVCAANENANLLEYPFAEVLWRQEFAPLETIRNQRIEVVGPGLGVSLNWSSRR